MVWGEWLGGWTAFLRVRMQIELMVPGEYTLAFLEGERLLASEGLTLVDWSEEGSDAKFEGKTR